MPSRGVAFWRLWPLPVNLIAKEKSVETESTVSGVKTAGRREAFVVIAAMFVFSIVSFSKPAGFSPGAIFGLGLVTYFVTVYLFRGIARLAYNRETYLLWIGLLLAIATGYVLAGLADTWHLLCAWSMLAGAGVITGRMNIREFNQKKIYAIGAVVVALFGVLQFIELWPRLIEVATQNVTDMTDEMMQSLPELGYTQDQTGESIETLRKAMMIFIRLLPAFMVTGLLLQFSLGYIWFLSNLDRRERFMRRLSPYLDWKMPFWLTPILIVVIISRLVGGEVTKLIADNILAGLSVYYCVTGLAVAEFFLKKMKLSGWMKVLFYILLFLTQLIGYFAAVLLGFIDSFVDWRKVEARVAA